MTRYCVIVGVSTFAKGETFRPLPFARNDAMRLYDVLTTYCHVVADDIILLVDDMEPLGARHSDPTRSEILAAIAATCRKAKENDEIVLFFAGHGVDISQQPYLLTKDTRLNVLNDSAIDLTVLNRYLKESRARAVLRIFDACRTPFTGSRDIGARMSGILSEAIFAKAKGWATLSACSSGESAYEMSEKEQGIFSYYLCEGLAGRAANEDGTVTFDRLVDYVKTSVGNYAESQSLSQTPHAQSDLEGVWSLSTRPRRSEADSVTSGFALSELSLGLQDHLSNVKSDARYLQYTTDGGLTKLCDLVLASVNRIISSFSSPSLRITTSVGNYKIADFDTQGWEEFRESITQTKLSTEYKNANRSFLITLEANEVVVPTTAVTVAVAQFSYFYWIWCRHRIEKNEMQRSFKAKLRRKKWFYTIAPKIAEDERRIDSTVQNMFSRVAESQLAWTRELTSFVDAQLEELRKLDSMVE